MTTIEWSREEERACIARVRRGDERERERFVRAYDSLMRRVTQPTVRSGGTMDDYMQQARMGLLHALSLFDESRGTRFWTYARWWVRAYVSRYAWANARIVPIAQSRAARRVFGALPLIEQKLGDRASNENLARALGVDHDDVARLRATRGSEIRIDAYDGGLDGYAWHTPAVDELLDDARLSVSRRRALRKALRSLDARGRYIIRRRFLHEPSQTLEEIGRSLALSRERVRQLESRALDHLRDVMTIRDGHLVSPGTSARTSPRSSRAAPDRSSCTYPRFSTCCEQHEKKGWDERGVGGGGRAAGRGAASVARRGWCGGRRAGVEEIGRGSGVVDVDAVDGDRAGGGW